MYVTPMTDAEIVAAVREILWPKTDQEQEWTPDTLDAVANAVGMKP